MIPAAARHTVSNTARLPAAIARRRISATAASLSDVSVEHGRGDGDTSEPGTFQIGTYNKISPVGLETFPAGRYEVKEGGDAPTAHAILLRSHKLTEGEVPKTVRAIARCGAGTNNVPVARMTELGIPVFNTPGANANAVKELVLAGLLLSSRRVVDGINHMSALGKEGLARERVEKDKALFGGREVRGKTLAVIGLGHIGAATAKDAETLGMKVIGYDPGLSVKSALKLPRSIELADSIVNAVRDADYISLNIPYIKGEGGTHGIIGDEVVGNLKNGAVLLNFARGELVDSDALKGHLESNDGKYVSDFPDDVLWDHPNATILPHLGASTYEAEDAAATMAANTIRDYLEWGTIKNSVNFPTTQLPAEHKENAIRFTVVTKNVPGMLAHISEAFATGGLNILDLTNQSRGDVAYNVVDVDTTGHEVMDFKETQERITMLEGVLSSRVIAGRPGTGYARNLAGDYFV